MIKKLIYKSWKLVLGMCRRETFMGRSTGIRRLKGSYFAVNNWLMCKNYGTHNKHF